MDPSVHLPIFNLFAPTPCKATLAKQELPIRTSSRSGEKPTPIFPSLKKPRPSTRSCDSFLILLRTVDAIRDISGTSMIGIPSLAKIEQQIGVASDQRCPSTCND